MYISWITTYYLHCIANNTIQFTTTSSNPRLGRSRICIMRKMSISWHRIKKMEKVCCVLVIEYYSWKMKEHSIFSLLITFYSKFKRLLYVKSLFMIDKIYQNQQILHVHSIQFRFRIVEKELRVLTFSIPTLQDFYLTFHIISWQCLVKICSENFSVAR